MAEPDDDAMMGLRVLLLAASVLLQTVLGHEASAAETVTTVRVGDHPGFGRLVFDLPAGARFDTVTEGDRVLVVFQGAGRFAGPGGTPRNVAALRLGEADATVHVMSGARVRTQKLGTRLVVDILDPPAARAVDREGAGPGGRGAGGHKEEAKPAGDGVAGPPGRSVAPSPARAQVAAAPVSDVAPAHVAAAEGAPKASDVVAPEHADVAEHGGAGEESRAIVQKAPVAAVQEAALPVPHEVAASALLPADLTIGVAAFRRADVAVVVLDRRVALDPPAGFPGATVVQGAVSSALVIPWARDRGMTVSRNAAGWLVEQSDALPALQADVGPGPGSDVLPTMKPVVVAEGVVLALKRPGRVVTMEDPVSGGTLLVGTSLSAGPENAVATGQRMPGSVLLPTWLGVAVDSIGDSVDLRAVASGFLLSGSGLRPALEAAGSQDRRFDLPNEPVPGLLNRLRAQLASAAEAAPRARTSARLGAAQAMLALGLAPEAQAVLQVVATEDPQAAADAQLGALLAASAVAAGRLDEAAALDDARLGETAEVLLWRGLRDRRMGRDTAAARGLPGQAALAWSYPSPLRRQVWPDVAEAVIETGGTLPAERVTPFAAGLALERAGKVEEALSAWDALAAGPDRLDQMRATVRGAELRLAAGRIGPAVAAGLIEGQAYAWRGDAREAALRLRAAELRAAAGEWRPALDALRATEAVFPDQHEAVQSRKVAVFAAMLAAQGDGMTPLELILMAADYADCVPEGQAGAVLASVLADRLTMLDLPARAIPVLQGLMKGAAAGPARAEFGTRLAGLLLDGGHPEEAVEALRASDGLAQAAQEARGLVMARTQAAQGDTAGAVAGLRAVGTAEADDMRARLLANAKDWPGTLAALSDLAAKRVPVEGPLSGEQQDIVMRQATAAVQAQDGATLVRLGPFAARLDTVRADLFRVLVQPPVSTTEELPRAKRELALARAIPQRLQELGSK